MKYILLAIFNLLILRVEAQFTSYSESEGDVMFTFNTFFSARTNSKVSQKYVLSAKDDYELTEQMGHFKNLTPVIEKAFELAECESCEQVSEKLTGNPIRYIFDVIEYQDVFLVTQYENQYKVIRYQPKTEE